MLSNPLIQRYRYSILRPKQFWVYTTIYISTTLLLVFISYSGYKRQTFFEDIVEFYQSLYYQFLTFQVLMLFIWSSYNSGSAIKEEISNKSFDFFRLLPLPAHKKAFGILIGKNLLVLLFGGINLGFLIYFGLAGRINISLQGQILLTLLSIAILTNLTCLLSSIRPTKKSKSSGIVLILFGIFFFVPMMINAIVALSMTDELQSYGVYFFKLKVPILLVISFIALYFCCWLFKGILRKFTHEQEPLFTRKGAMLFLVGYIFIAIGLYYFYLPKEDSKLVYLYWLSTLLPILLIQLASLRKLDSYIEYSRDLQGKIASGKTGIFAMLKYSNLTLAIALFAIWGVLSLGVTFLAKEANITPLPGLYNIFILLTCFLFLMLLLELYVVYKPVSSKIGLLLGFIAGLYLILPLIMGGIFDNDVIYHYSPIGFIGSLFDEPLYDNPEIKSTVRTTFWAMNTVFCILPAMLIWKRYSLILVQRQRM
ncbi:hypothetical protein ACFL3G_01035 [Planctomycetota bacterium]